MVPRHVLPAVVSAIRRSLASNEAPNSWDGQDYSTLCCLKRAGSDSPPASTRWTTPIHFPGGRSHQQRPKSSKPSNASTKCHQLCSPIRLRMTDKLLPLCPRPVLLIRPRFGDETPTLQTASKNKFAADFRQWLQLVPPMTLIVYSDGSLSPNGGAGYGYIIHQDTQPVLDGSGRLGPANVFDAEANGALKGLRATVGHPQATAKKIVVCLDNLAAATGLRGTLSDSSQAAFLEFRDMALAHGNTTVRWIPGHTNIAGNEQADALAKAGWSQPAPPDALPTLAYLRRVARKQPRGAFDAWWTTAAPERYKPLKLKASKPCPPELATPRPALHPRMAARTHHRDFANYHRRFKHANVRLTCSCGRPKELKHLFYCRQILPHHRLRLETSPTVSVNRALGKEFKKFVKMADDCDFFEKIYTRY